MKKALIGNGGHAREVLSQIGKNLPCFVDDEYVTENTLPLSSFDPKKYKIIVAIGDPLERKKIISKLPKNTKYFTFIHPSAQILDKKTTTIGLGSFIGANSILTTNISIGEHTILNRGNQIGHDTKIGDFLSAMPGSIVSGNCNLGDCVYLGTNSSIREKINICDNVTIGLGSGVVKHISEPGTYVGLPTKKIK
jgi:sugar O-acyltransferase (sialic acid O-acetyltransferase NeuD family)